MNDAAEPHTTDLDLGPGLVEVAVVGAHLSDMPLNHQLTERGGRLVRATRTSPVYRLFSLGGTPARPGLLRTSTSAVHDQGAGSLEVEVWALDHAGFGEFVTLVPSPLCIGRVELEDGSIVAGFLCEEVATRGCEDITAIGGWRAYVRSSTPG